MHIGILTSRSVHDLLLALTLLQCDEVEEEQHDSMSNADKSLRQFRHCSYSGELAYRKVHSGCTCKRTILSKSPYSTCALGSSKMPGSGGQAKDWLLACNNQLHLSP